MLQSLNVQSMDNVHILCTFGSHMLADMEGDTHQGVNFSFVYCLCFFFFSLIFILFLAFLSILILIVININVFFRIY